MSDLTVEQIFGRIIGFDTTSARSNLALVDFICEFLEPHASSIIRDRSDDGEKMNLLVRIGPDPDESRSGLVLSGHMDTVPALEPGWESDPFHLRETDDCWFARGTSDMKGFLALAIDLAAGLSGETLHSPLDLLFTYDEEVGTIGAKHWVDHRSDVVLPRAAIIGEPTELRIVSMHKGHLKLRITVRGVSAHSGYPHLGVNAIERAGSIITALSDLRIELQSHRSEDSDRFEPVPWVPLNIGEIRGGTAINIVPDLVEISLGVRMLPGMDGDELLDRIRERVDSATRDPAAVEVSLISESPPMKLDESAEVLGVLAKLTDETETRAVSFASDAGWFQTLDLDCVLYGPGSIEVAHKPNEYIEKDQFYRAKETIARIARAFCIEARS